MHNLIRIKNEQKSTLVDSINCATPVAGLTHNFHHYPARFSPVFARTIISLFTSPLDVVMDPFMGGGTTLVEGLAAGRRVLGADINPLATFTSKVKTTPLGHRNLTSIQDWHFDFVSSVNLRGPSRRDLEWKQYQKDVPWHIRRAIESLLGELHHIQGKDAQDFLRCAVLKTGQWALDCKKDIPSSRAFLNAFTNNLDFMIGQMEDFTASVKASFRLPIHKIRRNSRIFQRPVEGLEHERRLPRDWPPPKLILTSPPYPGVHVLYHRWQIHGRKETPAPFWLLNMQDGNGESYYTMGNRKRRGLQPYFDSLYRSFKSIREIVARSTIVVVLIAFSKPNWQLARFLETMSEAGFEEVILPGGNVGTIRRITRNVPNRRWYADMRGRISSSREILFFFKPKR